MLEMDAALIIASFLVVASSALLRMVWRTCGVLFCLSLVRGYHLVFDHQDY